jgi:hypothetical protein
MKPESTLPCLQGLATDPYPELDESVHALTRLLKTIIYLSVNTQLNKSSYFVTFINSIIQCTYCRYGDVSTTTCFDLFRSSSGNLNLTKTIIVAYMESILKLKNLKKLKIQIVKKTFNF